MTRPFLFISLFLLMSCRPDRAHEYAEEDLNEHWEFYYPKDDSWFPAQVPGVIHLDLLENDLIDDPYWEMNEYKQRRIEHEDWTYRSSFRVDEKILKRDAVALQFEGLDTYAEVFLNGTKILEADNMFRNWEVEVKRWLIPGENELRIQFRSPIKENQERVAQYPYTLPSGNEGEDIPVKVSSFTRKAAYQFGWDWGPRFVTSGVWRPVKLVSWDGARILDIYTRTLSIGEERAKMETELEIEVLREGDYSLHMDDRVLELHLYPGRHIIIHPFEVVDPQLWWTRDLGDPHLYSQKIHLFKKDAVIDSLSNSYGIRTINLVNEEDSIGMSFYFELNGRPLFMKGANYIPQDLFLPRVRKGQYEALIRAAADAHMNMLRVWGGGIYEDDIFYELCDKNGILIWQDLMFAGSLYPSDSGFLANVEQEVIDNVKRLRGHPCLALWCGNNEIEVAWKNWGWQSQYGYSPEDSMQLWLDYKYLFREFIPRLVSTYDASTDYTPTSPLSNWGTAENFNHSSMHYWGVWHGREPFENFDKNVGRFMVEYGFQSFPDLETLQEVVSESALELNSAPIRHRQKSYIGNGLILEHMDQYGYQPKNFEEFIRMSQEVQSKALQMAIEAHINAQPHCMGTLFWQLNDCWPGPSWSVIDYYGRKKIGYTVVSEKFGP